MVFNKLKLDDCTAPINSYVIILENGGPSTGTYSTRSFCTVEIERLASRGGFQNFNNHLLTEVLLCENLEAPQFRRGRLWSGINQKFYINREEEIIFNCCTPPEQKLASSLASSLYNVVGCCPIQQEN